MAEIQVKYKLVPRLSYKLMRVATNENGVAIEVVGEFNDIITANDVAKAYVEAERKQSRDRNTGVLPYVEYRDQ